MSDPELPSPPKELFPSAPSVSAAVPAVNATVVDNGHLIFSKRMKLYYEAPDILKINGELQELDEGTFIPDYALSRARAFYERYLRDCITAENLIVLTGAGSSMGLEGRSGLSMKGLWESAEKVLGEKFDQFCKLVHYDVTEKNLEALLTFAELYLSYNKKLTHTSGSAEEANLKLVTNMNDIIKGLILTECDFADKKEGEADSFSEITHLHFLQNISYRKNRLSRPKIFTTNYDRTFEVAANSGVFITIDGFSFNNKRKFNGKFYDYDIVLTKNNRVSTEDNFAPNVIHLYKLHGSVDWFQEGDDIYQKYQGVPEKFPNGDLKLPLMIFPNKEKFQLSYHQPYFEMMSRFQNELRKSNSTTLLIIGYSFGDDHLNRVIEEALLHNAFLKIIVVDKYLELPFADNISLKKLLQIKAEQTEQVLFIREAFKDFVTYMPSPKERSIEILGDINEQKPEQK